MKYKSWIYPIAGLSLIAALICSKPQPRYELRQSICRRMEHVAEKAMNERGTYEYEGEYTRIIPGKIHEIKIYVDDENHNGLIDRDDLVSIFYFDENNTTEFTHFGGTRDTIFGTEESTFMIKESDDGCTARCVIVSGYEAEFRYLVRNVFDKVYMECTNDMETEFK